MKKTINATILALAVALFSCKTTSTTTTPPVTDNCKNVPKLNWQTESRGLDVETTLKLITEIKVAAQADLAKSKELNASGTGNVNIQSELARAVSKNVVQSQSVTQDFWQQDLTFRQILCYYDNKINDKNIPEDIKKQF